MQRRGKSGRITMGAGSNRSRSTRDSDSMSAAHGLGQFAYHFGFLSSVLAAKAAGLSLWGQSEAQEYAGGATGAMAPVIGAGAAPLLEDTAAESRPKPAVRNGDAPRPLPPRRQETCLGLHRELDLAGAKQRSYVLRKERAS